MSEYMDIKNSNSDSVYEMIDYVEKFDVLAPLARIYTQETDPVLKKIGEPACLSRIQNIEASSLRYDSTNSYEFIDITIERARGYAKEFAPTWGMVMGVRTNTSPKSQYIEQYIEILNEVLPETWVWLWDKAQKVDKVYITCFCPALTFCHTYIMLAYAQHVMPTHFVLDRALPSWAADIWGGK